MSETRPPCGHKYCPSERCAYSGPLVLSDALTYKPMMDFSVLDRAFRQMRQAAERAARTLTRMYRLLSESANDEVRVSGLEAKYHVRGAFLVTHLSCTDGLTGSIGHLVQEIMGGRNSDTVFLTRANRARVATAAMLGYVEHHPGEALPVAWHSTNVLTGRG